MQKLVGQIMAVVEAPDGLAADVFAQGATKSYRLAPALADRAHDAQLLARVQDIEIEDGWITSIVDRS